MRTYAVLWALLLLLIPQPAHSLNFDLTWDLSLLNTTPETTYAWGIDWGESQGYALNRLSIYNIRWGEGGGTTGPSIFNPTRGSLDNGRSLQLYNHNIWWQPFHPSDIDPLRMHIELTERDYTDFGTYGEIALFVWPFDNVCLEPCSINIGMFGNQAREPGTHLWTLFARGESPSGLEQPLPAPILTNVRFGPEQIATPEPGTWILLVSGLLALLLWRRWSVVCLLLLCTAQAQAATHLCNRLGDAVGSYFGDTWPQGSTNRTPQQPLPYTNCPTSYTRYPTLSSPERYLCVSYANRVTNINANGWGACLGASNVITGECFNEDTCRAFSGGDNGMCTPETITAINTSLDANAYDCNNMQGQVSVGIWTGPVGEEFACQQDNQSKTVTCTLNTDKSPVARARCGIWQVTGTVQETGSAKFDLRNFNANTPRCVQWVSVDGFLTQWSFAGHFLNQEGKRGSFDMTRSTPAPGFATAPHALLTVGNQIPWISETPGSVATVPTAPQLMTPSVSGNGFIYIEWLPAHDAEFYNVYVSATPGGANLAQDHLPNTTTAFKVVGLTNGIRYYFTVVAGNAAGLGPYSNQVTWVPVPMPQAFLITSYANPNPNNLPVPPPTPGKVQLKWGASANASYYTILTAPSEHGPWTPRVSNLPATTLTATVSGLTDYVGQAFKVQAINANNERSDSSKVWAASPCGRRKCQP